MWTTKVGWCIALSVIVMVNVWAADAYSILAGYQAAGAGPFDGKRGELLWRQEVNFPALGVQRRCADCHADNLRTAGKHIQTGKLIQPLAPSVTPSRFTDVAKVEKWFERNCKGTWGRTCTIQEKGDLITWIATQ